MITFNEACKIAYNYYANQGCLGLKASNDLGDTYSFMGYIDPIPYGGIVPITVSKRTGEIGLLPFYLPGFFEKFNNSTELEIPAEYKPKEESMYDYRYKIVIK